jgi:hypothetical protein
LIIVKINVVATSKIILSIKAGIIIIVRIIIAVWVWNVIFTHDMNPTKAVTMTPASAALANASPMISVCLVDCFTCFVLAVLIERIVRGVADLTASAIAFSREKCFMIKSCFWLKKIPPKWDKEREKIAIER